MEHKEYSLGWEKRFDDIYFDAKLNDVERLWALKDQLKEERRNSVMDIIMRVTKLPIGSGLTIEQEKVLTHIRNWYSKDCIPKIIKDYEMEKWDNNN